jgi:hypothetical protein
MPIRHIKNVEGTRDSLNDGGYFKTGGIPERFRDHHFIKRRGSAYGVSVTKQINDLIKNLQMKGHFIDSPVKAK